MAHGMYKLVALDVDGTIRTIERSPSERTRRAIDAVRAAGAAVTLATGRIFASAASAAAELGIVTPIVTFQGAVVAVFNRRADLSDLEPVVQAFKAGLSVDTGESLPAKDYQRLIKDVDGLSAALAAVTRQRNPAVRAAAVEFILEGLHLNKRLNKDQVSGQARYRG